MKKSRIIYICLFCIILIISEYFDLYLKLESIYWLATKIIVTIILIIIVLVRTYKQDGIVVTIVCICLASFPIGYMSYREINKYKMYELSLSFNETRRKIGAPEIPDDWHLGFTTNKWVSWKASDAHGHVSKDIMLDSNYKIELETDEYNLKPENRFNRSITITTKYARGKSKDSMFYYYEASANNNKPISKLQADSIFATEKIKKDY